MNKKAFTLIEVMIVVAIIGILVLLVFPTIHKAKIESNHAFAKSTLNTIAKGLEMYNSINHEYPSDVNELYVVNPPYLHKDYFSTQYRGYEYSSVISNEVYEITATPIGSMGVKTFKITTGAILTEGE